MPADAVKTLHRIALLGSLLSIALAGCAGYRGGWQSVAYIGQASAAPAEAISPRERPKLRVPGLQMEVELDNQLRTYDTQVYFFALPLSIDPRKVYPQNHLPGRTRVFVTVTPSEAGFVFRPSEAMLGVADSRFPGAAGYEFGMWDRGGRRVRQGGTWDHRPVGAGFVLSEPGRTYYLSIDFATPVPSPESRDIVLDLARALASPRYPGLPLVRFAPMRWKEGYT